MLSLFKNLFGGGDNRLAEALAKGALVVDVRTREEYAGGHVKGSVNIPLGEISSQAKKLKDHPAIVVCCRSGNRSGQAKSILDAQGFTNVINGGSWQNVNNQLKKKAA